MSERLTKEREASLRKYIESCDTLDIDNLCDDPIVVLMREIDALRNENVGEGEDRNYYQAIVDGSWPTSTEIILRHHPELALRSDLQSSRLEGFKEGVEAAWKCADKVQSSAPSVPTLHQEGHIRAAYTIASQIRQLTQEGK
jgi:hypothetical protein